MSTVKSGLDFNSATFSKDISVMCRSALARAVGYLVETSCPDGKGWSDFPTNRSGESTSWVTAHVLWQVGTLLPKSLSETSFRALLSQKQQYGAWGFSQFVPPDCDSTLHALRAMLTLEAKEVDVSESIEFVLSHQTEEGGFSTYKDGLSLVRYRGTGDETNYDGWTQPHVCVTAVALEVLSHFPELVPDHVLDNAINFLLEAQAPEGYWESYWWRSKYFATSRIIKQFNSINDKRVKAALTRARDWVLRTANARGYWDNGYDREIPCALSTAHCVDALVATGAELDSVIESVPWLLAQQNDDGSWMGVPLLRIPPSHIKKPDDFADWRIGGRGVGSCCADKKRIYTTSSVAGAMNTFAETLT
jgi:squalene-hopene/tetraprenyl-beta-curcumene cyclase